MSGYSLQKLTSERSGIFMESLQKAFYTYASENSVFFFSISVKQFLLEITYEICAADHEHILRRGIRICVISANYEPKRYLLILGVVITRITCLDWSRQGCVWFIRQFIIQVHSLTSIIDCCLSVKLGILAFRLTNCQLG